MREIFHFLLYLINRIRIQLFCVLCFMQKLYRAQDLLLWLLIVVIIMISTKQNSTVFWQLVVRPLETGGKEGDVTRASLHFCQTLATFPARMSYVYSKFNTFIHLLTFPEEILVIELRQKHLNVVMKELCILLFDWLHFLFCSCRLFLLIFLPPSSQ